MEPQPQKPQADRPPPPAAPPARAFEARFYPDRLTVLNAYGDVGLLTLWTRAAVGVKKLNEMVPEGPARDRVAVVANLYGDGLYELFGNLLHNPQIRHLVAVGEDLGQPTVGEVRAFFLNGLEDAELLGRRFRRIRGTQRLLPVDPDFDEVRLRARVTFHHLGKFSGEGVPAALPALLRDLPEHPDDPLPRIEVALRPSLDDDYEYRPSEAGGHQVVRRRPLDAWEELVARTMRFGRPLQLVKGSRLELPDAKVVITEPEEEPAGALASRGFDIANFRAYQREILDAALPEGISYTYGNRLRGYYTSPGGPDTLATVVALLRDDPASRHAFVSLWDTERDLVPPDEADDKSRPCLVTLRWRVYDGAVHLTATYRSHNLLSAWLQNVYGLMALQEHVADQLLLGRGTIVVVSHSLTIDPASPRAEQAKAIADNWQDDDVDRETGAHRLREDPHGYFVVSTDARTGTIVAQHKHNGVVLGEYRERLAARIARRIAADNAVSVPSHALWLGQELARAQAELRRAGAPQRPEMPPLLVFDLGATLVAGPSQGPARRLAELLALDADQTRQLSESLMSTDVATAGDLADLLRTLFALDGADPAAAARQVWAAQEQEAELLPGAMEALTTLADAGYEFAVLSNIWRPYLTAVERQLGDFLHRVVPPERRAYSFREGTAKPSPELLRRLLKATGVRPEDAVMIGDSYTNDMGPALAEGLRAVWVLHRPDHEATSMTRVLSGELPAPTRAITGICELTPELLASSVR